MKIDRHLAAETVSCLCVLGRLTISISFPERIPGRVCDLQTAFLSHPGSGFGNLERNLRRSELWGAQHRDEPTRLPELSEERAERLTAH